MGAKGSVSEPTRRNTARMGEAQAEAYRPTYQPSPQPTAKNRPPDSEVLAEFRSKLNVLPLSEEQKLILQEQSVDVKHQLLCKLKELQMDDVSIHGPSQMLQQIQDTPTLRSFRQLLKWLKTAQDSDVVSFIDSRGIDVLINMLIVTQELAKNTKNYEKQILILRCLQELNRFEDGTVDLIYDELKVVYIALSLSMEDEASSVSVIDLLVDFCWYSNEGYEVVAKSIEVLALDKGLGNPLAFFLSVLQSPSTRYAFKHKAMTLINTLVQSPLEVDVQTDTHRKLVSMGIHQTLTKLKAQIADIAPVRRRNVRAFQFETKRLRIRESRTKEEMSKGKASAVMEFDPDNIDRMVQSRNRRKSGEKKLIKPTEELAVDSKVSEIIHSTIDVSVISAFVERQAVADPDAEDIADEDYALALLDQIELFEEEEDDTEVEAIPEPVIVPLTSTEALVKALEHSAREAGAHDILLQTLQALLTVPTTSDDGKSLKSTLQGISESVSGKSPEAKSQAKDLAALRDLEARVDNLTKTIETRDIEIEKLWKEKKEIMEEESRVRKALEEQCMEVMKLREEGKTREEIDIQQGKPRASLEINRVETIYVIGEPVKTHVEAVVATIPQAPSISVPTAPVLSIPQAPSITVPTAPTLSIPSAPQLSIPTAPQLSIPTAPQLSIPTAPALSVPTAPQLSIPTTPKLGIPVAPSLSIPTAPALNVPPAPRLNVPTAPPLSIPTAPQLTVPNAPTLSIPSAPALNLKQGAPPAPQLNLGAPPAPQLNFGAPPAPQLNIGAPPAPQLNIGAPPAPLLSLGAPPAPQLNLGAPPAPQLNLGAPPAPQLNLGAPPAPRLNIGAPPAPQLNLGAPPAPQLNLGTPPAPQLNLGAPPAPQLNLGAPPAPRLNIGAPPAPQLNLGAPPAPQLNLGAPPAPQLNIGAPPAPQLNLGAPPAPRLNIGAPSAPQLNIGAPAAPQLNLKPGVPTAPSINLGAPAAPSLNLGAPPAPKIGVPSAPSLGGVPAAPAFGGAPGAPTISALVQAALPPKEKRKPATSMKSLFWTPLTNAPKILNSIWKKVDDTKVQIDEESIIALFAQKKQAPKPLSDAPVQAQEQKPMKISLYPKERSQNIQLLLGKLRMSNPAIVEALLRLDESVLTRNNLITLKAGMPTDEEIGQLQGYEEDPSQLGVTERFFLSLKEVPQPLVRIDAVLFQLNSSEMIEELSLRLRRVELTFKSFQDSEKFKGVMEVVLAVGNYLNGTTNRGGCYGFSIGSLQKVMEMKAQDNKTTLLEYVVGLCFKSYPPLLLLQDDFPYLLEASKIPISQYRIELSEIEKAYRSVVKAIESQSTHPSDCVKTKLEQFSREFRPSIDGVKTRVDALDGKFAGLCDLLGTDVKEMPLEELLDKMNAFISSFEACRAKMEKAQAEQERQSRIEARKKAAEATRVESGKTMDTASLAQEIRRKRQMKGEVSAQSQPTPQVKKTTAEQLHDVVRTRRGSRVSRDEPR